LGVAPFLAAAGTGHSAAAFSFQGYVTSSRCRTSGRLPRCGQLSPASLAVAFVLLKQPKNKRVDGQAVSHIVNAMTAGRVGGQQPVAQGVKLTVRLTLESDVHPGFSSHR